MRTIKKVAILLVFTTVVFTTIAGANWGVSRWGADQWGTGKWGIGGIAANVAYLAENFLQTLSDRVSLTPVGITLTTGRPNGDDGTLAGTDEATIDSAGKWHTFGSFLQLCPYSEDSSNWTGSGPWTQSISLTNLSTYTVSTNLNGATVTITAGTATIDAGASATYGVPDQFIVSVAGTVTITTDTADPKSQLTETAYKFPYLINTTAGTLSSPLNYSSVAGGYTYDIATMPRLLDVLDGAADGTVVLDDNFSTDTSASYIAVVTTKTYDAINELLKAEFTTTDNNRGIRRSILEIGKNYDIRFKAKGTRSAQFATIGNTSELNFATNPTLTTEWQDYGARCLALTVDCKLYMAAGAVGEYVEFDDIFIREISDAQGQIVLKGSFEFDAADATGTVNILTFNGDSSPLRYDIDNEQFEAFDGTNEAVVAHTAVNGDDYEVHLSFAGSTMQLIADTTEGSEATFDGAFPVGTEMSLSYDNPEWLTFESITIYDEADIEIFTFWETAYGTDWTVAYGADWTLPYNTEI